VRAKTLFFLRLLRRRLDEGVLLPLSLERPLTFESYVSSASESASPFAPGVALAAADLSDRGIPSPLILDTRPAVSRDLSERDE
jgi:hypothetical protein